MKEDVKEQHHEHSVACGGSDRGEMIGGAKRRHVRAVKKGGGTTSDDVLTEAQISAHNKATLEGMGALFKLPYITHLKQEEKNAKRQDQERHARCGRIPSEPGGRSRPPSGWDGH